MNISILGDSISTYIGFNPPGYSVHYDSNVIVFNGLKSEADTWWGIVINSLGGCLCMNNSYSGSRVSGEKFPAANCTERINNLKFYDQIPDIIFVYLGFNDFGYGVTVNGRKNDLTCFYSAYCKMLSRIKKAYPKSIIYCFTLMQTYVRGKDYWSFPNCFGGLNLELYNGAIRKAVRGKRCRLIDLAASGEKYETLDGSHPTAVGHRKIAETVIRLMK